MLTIKDINLGLNRFNVESLLRSNIITPGDYAPYARCNNCVSKYGYHICELYPKLRMYQAIGAAHWKKYYSKLQKQIKQQGLTVPLAAKYGHDNSYVVLIDGHTRLAIAYELDIAEVDVYVSTYDTHTYDLTAGDSGWWESGVDSPWLSG